MTRRRSRDAEDAVQCRVRRSADVPNPKPLSTMTRNRGSGLGGRRVGLWFGDGSVGRRQQIDSDGRHHRDTTDGRNQQGMFHVDLSLRQTG